MYDPDKSPDFSGDFPSVDPNLKIKPDLDNEAHGPHFDALQSIPGGTDQVRITPEGDVAGGTTNLGPFKVQW